MRSLYISIQRLGVICALLGLLGLNFSVDSMSVNYLKAHAVDPWAGMALGSQGIQIADTSVYENQIAQAHSALAVEAPLLALYAQGKDVTAGQARLLSYFNNAQLGVPTSINDDIFGLLALHSYSQDADKITAIKVFILNAQNSDGGWPFSANGLSDSNTTAMALIALNDAGGVDPSVFQKGLSYLHAAQGDDGGFRYSARAEFGVGSDGNSTAWVISALKKFNESPDTWIKQGHTPLEFLARLKRDDGSFASTPGSPADSFTSTLTAYAVIALSDATYPVSIASGPPASAPSTIEQRVDLSVTIPAPVVPIVAAPPSSDTTQPQTTSAVEHTSVTQQSQVVSFIVDGDSLNFGQVAQGHSSQRDISISNDGTVGLIVAPRIEGDSVFLNNITLNASSWRNASYTLATGGHIPLHVQLSVPSGYGDSGIRNGIMTFIGRAQN